MDRAYVNDLATVALIRSEFQAKQISILKPRDVSIAVDQGGGHTAINSEGT